MITTVLIIDSNIPFMISLKQALEETGDYRVAMAAHTDAAEEVLSFEPPDIAVLDFKMSGMDAMMLIRLLRNIQPELAIVITPHDDIQFERAQFMDVQAVLKKPYTARDLLPRLRKVQRRSDTYDFDYSAPPPADRPPAEPFELEDDEAGEQPEPERLFNLDRLAKPAPSRDTEDADTTGDEADAVEAAAAYDAADDAGYAAAGYDDEVYDDDYDDDDYGDYDNASDDIPAEDPHGTRILNMSSGPGAPQDELYDPYDPHSVRPGSVLDDDDDVSDTTTLLEWARPEETDHLGETEVLNTETWRIQGRKRETRPLEPRPDEPPRTSRRAAPDDDDFDAMQPFVDDDPTAEGEGFDDVLDAVARSSERDRTSEDREFHELVESMRRDQTPRPRRSRLEDLLSSAAPDSDDEVTPPEVDDTFDRVFDVIRQGRDARKQNADLLHTEEDETDDTTIGDVIDELFDPSFEGVLAALSGESIDDVTIEEPTYGVDERTSRPAPDIREQHAEEGGADSAITEPDDDTHGVEYSEKHGEPSAHAPGETRDERPIIDEPPVGEEDSTSYPATTALAVVSGDDDALSLDELLSQIEQQLPTIHPGRPRLKPLPSWRRTGHLESGSNLARLFDNIENARPNVKPDVPGAADAQPPRPSAPPRTEAPASNEVTRAVPARDPDRDDMLSMEELFARADLPPEAGTEEIVQDRAQYGAYDDEDAGTRADGPSDDEIASMFYEGVRDQEPLPAARAPEPPDELPEPVPAFDMADDADADFDAADEYDDEDDEDYEDYEVYDESDEFDADDIAEVAPGDDDTAVYDADVPFILEDDESLIPMPVDEATQRIEAASAEADEAEAERAEAEDAASVAHIAVQLTQYSLESSAQATMLAREGTLLAHAGHVDEDTLWDLFEAVDHAWTRSTVESESLIRMVELPDGDDFMVYSTRLTDDMTLSMAFHSNTSLRLIRRQARRVSESLDLVPEAIAELDDENVSPAAQTLPSRPTSAAPPDGWPQAAQDDLPQRPAHDSDEHYTAYTALWMPYDPGHELQGDFAAALEEWISATAEESAWELLDLNVHADYVALTLSTPQKLSPDTVVTHLMQDTAERAADAYPDLTSEDTPLWTDGYYVVTPPRALTDREIARIVTVQRNAQLER